MFEMVRYAFHKRWNTYWSKKEITTRFASADDLFEWWLLHYAKQAKLGDYLQVKDSVIKGKEISTEAEGILFTKN